MEFVLSTSFQCSIFINVFACADAASVHYNHSFDSESWGEYFFFRFADVCLHRANGYALDESQKQSEQTRKQIASGRNSCKQFFCSFCITFSLVLSSISQVVLFERLWTFVHIFIFRIRDELQMCDCWKWRRRRRAEKRIENECRQTGVDNKSTLVDLFERYRWRVSIVHVFCLAEIAMNCRSTESLTSGFIESNAGFQFCDRIHCSIPLQNDSTRYAIADAHLSYWILRERLIKLTASIYFAPS